jgi:hypothetical protein
VSVVLKLSCSAFSLVSIVSPFFLVSLFFVMIRLGSVKSTNFCTS